MKLTYAFLLLISFTVKSQVDTLFWFAAPEVTSLHGDRPIRLVISSYSNAGNVKVDIPSNSSFVPIQISLESNSSTIIDLTNQIDLIENGSFNTINTTGIRVQSTVLISAYYEVLGRDINGVVNTDIFTLKGNNALGNEFYLPFQTRYNNETVRLGNTAWAAVEILATENNTVIDIFPTQNFFGHAANFSITLNKGEVYVMRADTTVGSLKPIATKIVSNKPVSVTINDDSILHEAGGWDLIGDQIIPISKLGFDYIIRTGVVYVIATEDGTDVTLDGVLDTTLNQGEFYEIVISEGGHYLNSSEPIAVFQTIALGGELGAAVLPQINCTGSNSIRFTRSTSEPFFLDLIAKKGSENNFTINGSSTAISASAFKEVPGTNGKWLFATIDFSGQDIIKTNTLSIVTNEVNPFHLAVLNGKPNVTGARYGFFSNFGSFDLGEDLEICGDQSFSLRGGLGRDFYNWTLDGSPISMSEVIEVTQSGVYKLNAQEGLNCQIEDSIKITFFDFPKVDLQYDIKFCEKDTLVIEATPNFEEYQWSPLIGSDSSLNISEPGIYSVVVSDTNSCSVTKTTTFISMTPLPKVELGPETQFICSNSRKSFSLDSQFNYLWEDGSESPDRTISESGLYHVQVFNECDTVEDQVAFNTWDIDYPNVLTPNGDGKNETFHISGISFGEWSLIINNRHGKTVYKTEDYKNDYIPEGLTDGIYYFVLSHGDDCTTFTGWIQIIR